MLSFLLQDMPDSQRVSCMRKHGKTWAASASVREAHAVWTRSNPQGTPSLQSYHRGPLSGLQGVSNAYRQRNVIEGIDFLTTKVGDVERSLTLMQEMCDSTDEFGKKIFRTYLEFTYACVLFGQREAVRIWDEKLLSQDPKAIRKRQRLDEIKTLLRSELVKRDLCNSSELVL